MTRICTVVKEPNRFDGKRVAVNGCVTTDGFEHVSLSDPAGCEFGALVPIDSVKLPPNQRYVLEPNERLCGLFTGTFRAATVVYDRVLEVENATNLHRMRKSHPL